MSSKDIIRLKLEKRLLEEKLQSIDEKYLDVSSILQRKMMQKKASSESFSTFADTICSKDGIPISEFRQTFRTSHKLPLIARTNSTSFLTKVTDSTPVPITNSNILRIRQSHVMKKVGNDRVEEKVAEKKLMEEKLSKRNKTKTYPVAKVPTSFLPNRYIRGELPCTIEHGMNGHYLSWACPLENLDYEFYLPIFFDGLQCKGHPISFLARQGIEDMLYASRGYPDRIVPIIKSLCSPLRNALSKFDSEVLLGTLKAIQQLVQCNPEVGPVLLPFSKIFLSPMALFMDQNKNIGDSIDYGQRKNDDVGEEVRKTLELLEETGGPNAYKLIKFSVPLYESCLRAPDAHHNKKR